MRIKKPLKITFIWFHTISLSQYLPNSNQFYTISNATTFTEYATNQETLTCQSPITAYFVPRQSPPTNRRAEFKSLFGIRIEPHGTFVHKVAGFYSKWTW